MELEDIHLTILCVTALVILYSDHVGFNYFRERTLTLSRSTIVWSHRLVWVGLVGMIATGIALMLPSYEYWLSLPSFYVKMAFVLTLIVNALFIGKLSHVATETPYSLLDDETRKTLLTSGALSTMCWIGAAVIGLFIF